MHEPDAPVWRLPAEMLAAAGNLEFERAAPLRDRMAELQGQPKMTPQVKKGRRRKKTQRG